jgi:hypothetical protein
MNPYVSSKTVESHPSDMSQKIIGIFTTMETSNLI